MLEAHASTLSCKVCDGAWTQSGKSIMFERSVTSGVTPKVSRCTPHSPGLFELEKACSMSRSREVGWACTVRVDFVFGSFFLGGGVFFFFFAFPWFFLGKTAVSLRFGRIWRDFPWFSYEKTCFLLFLGFS